VKFWLLPLRLRGRLHSLLSNYSVNAGVAISTPHMEEVEPNIAVRDIPTNNRNDKARPISLPFLLSRACKISWWRAANSGTTIEHLESYLGSRALDVE
jgi:hypothetical protein